MDEDISADLAVERTIGAQMDARAQAWAALAELLRELTVLARVGRQALEREVAASEVHKKR